MSREVHVQFWERAGVRFPCATHLVVQCRSQSEAQGAIEQIQRWAQNNGLIVHPTKTRIVDTTQRGGFDFLGYHFERGMKWPRKKSMEKFRESIRRHTRRSQGHSMAQIIATVNPVMRGWFEYFKHSHPPTFRFVDGWVRGRLRSILRRWQGKRGRSRGSDQQRWPNVYFDQLGLYNLVRARALVLHSR